MNLCLEKFAFLTWALAIKERRGMKFLAHKSVHSPGEQLIELATVKVDCDFEETVGDWASAQRFDEILTAKVANALNVSEKTVEVLCHQRGSVVAVVAMLPVGVQDADLAPRTPAELTEALVDYVQSGENRLGDGQLGARILEADKLGPVSQKACQVISDAFSVLRARGLRLSNAVLAKEEA
eukprot:3095432-Rhodomonas_salina.1